MKNKESYYLAHTLSTAEGRNIFSRPSLVRRFIKFYFKKELRIVTVCLLALIFKEIYFLVRHLL